MKVVLASFACVTALRPHAASGLEGSAYRPAARSTKGAVAAETAQATQAGVAVLREGGNAVDAAVASVFALGVTSPGECGLGGGVRIIYRSANGQTAVIDGGAKSPAATTPTAIGSTPGGIDSTLGAGHRVVAVPGTVAGLAELLASYGTITLARALAPAERLADDGFPVGPDLAFHFRVRASQLKLYPQTAAIFLRRDGAPYEQGSTLVQRDLATTLHAVATEGPSAFYTGSVAARLAAEFSKPPLYPGDESILTAADLANYAPAHRSAIEGQYRGAQVLTVPAPMYGANVIETLNILSGFPMATFGPSSADALHVLAEAQKIAEVDSDAVMTDPAFSDVPVAALTSPDYAALRRSEITMAKAKTYAPGVAAFAQGAGHPSNTTSVSAVDTDGNAVVITCTLSNLFGSYVVAEGTGVVLNNSMTGFLGGVDEPEGNKFLATAIAPTIVVKDGLPLLAIGAGGSASIYRSIPEVISDMLDFGMDIAHAIDAERFHGYQDAKKGPWAYAEDARIGSKVMAELKHRGHHIENFGLGIDPSWVEYAWYNPVGRVHAAGIDPRTLERVASSDPRALGGLALGE